jgi:hypothetical protein
LLLGPGRVAERPVWADLDSLPGDIDLPGSLPVVADGLVRQPLWRSQISELSE